MWIHSSAYRHGLDDADITHAWANALGFYDYEPDHDPPKGLCIGPDAAANLVELLYLEFEDNDLIIHAMALRPVLRAHLTGGEA